MQWRIQKFEGAEDNLSVPFSFIANAHNEICLLHGKSGFLKKKYEPIGGGAPPPTLNPPLIR